MLEAWILYVHQVSKECGEEPYVSMPSRNTQARAKSQDIRSSPTDGPCNAGTSLSVIKNQLWQDYP